MNRCSKNMNETEIAEIISNPLQQMSSAFFAKINELTVFAWHNSSAHQTEAQPNEETLTKDQRCGKRYLVVI